MNIDEAAVRLEAICAQWGMPWAELKLDGEVGNAPGEHIVRIAITAEFLRDVEPYLLRKGYVSKQVRRHCLTVDDLGLLLGISGRHVRRHLAEMRRWLPVANTLPVTARAMPTVRMTGPDRASLEEEQLGGGLQ